MGVDAQAEEIKNARLDKQFDKIKIFDSSDPSACHQVRVGSTQVKVVHMVCCTGMVHLQDCQQENQECIP